MPKYHETILVKLLYAFAFLVAGVASFLATAGFAEWLKASTGVFATVPIQLVVVAFPAYLIPSTIEGRIIWRLTGEDGFNTVSPVSLGLVVGYMLHFA